MSHESRPPPMQPPHDLLEQLRATTHMLEQIAADARLAEALPPAERERLFQAVARVHHPDHADRRLKRRAAARERRATHNRESEAVLHETGIRALRRKPVFTAPAFFAPLGFSAQDIPPGEDGAGSQQGTHPEPQHCYVCKAKYQLVHHFYDQLCPACAELNFSKRTELADLRGRVSRFSHDALVNISAALGRRVHVEPAEVSTPRFCTALDDTPNAADTVHRSKAGGETLLRALATPEAMWDAVETVRASTV